MKSQVGIKQFLIMILFHTFFGYIWNTLVFDLSFMNNIISLFFVAIALSFLFSNRLIRIQWTSLLWIPYLIYTIIGYLFHFEYVYACYWIVCLVLVILGMSVNSMHFESLFPYKFIWRAGLFCLIGVYFELLFHGLYDMYIATLFKTSERIIAMGHANYGFAGFTYQLDTTAMPIVFALAIFLYINHEKHTNKFQIGIYALFFIAVVLTGKRISILLIVVIPLFIYIFSNKIQEKRWRNALFALAISLLGVYFVISNAGWLYESSIFHRIGSTIINLQKGNDITAGRNVLYEKALEIFSSHKLFGIGIGKFINYSGANTDVHNVYLQVLCEQGIFGEILFVIPLIMCLLTNIRRLINVQADRNKSAYMFTLYVQMVYILYGLTGNLNINLYGYMMYFVSIFLLETVISRENIGGSFA